MSQSHPSGLLAAYNSLTDKHLAGYFNNTRIRRHLLRSGLITRSGRIISEKEYKLNIMKKDHQKYIRECFAQAIFHKVLDMERYHQLEIKRKLETLARKERIQRFKGEPIKWPLEKNMPALPPHLPVVPKTKHGHSVLVDEGRSSLITLVAPRPYTAPGVLQPPIRLQPLPSNPAVGTVPKVTSGSRSKLSTLENEAPFPIGGKKAEMKFRNLMDNSQGMNRYQLLNINSYMMPSPPPPPPLNGKITEENRPETWRRRRFHPTTAPNGLEPVFTRDSRRMNKTPLHSNAVITMIYLGKNVHLSYDHPDFRDEIKVYQQHCGGENLCVFKGKLLEKETFQFISKRHHGFPFSLTFFLNGMQVNRLSSCCEYKHRKGSRLGGKRGYFGFVCVERSSPCYKCIIAMGLDKRPPSPKPRKQTSVEKREELKKGEGRLRKDRAYLKPRRNKMLGSNASASVIFAGEEAKTGIEDVRTAVGEMERKGKPHIWEDDQENMFRYEYEEDFEVDEEKQDRKANKGQAEDGMNALSMSPSNKEKGNEDLEKESVSSSQKAPNADDNVKDKGDGCTESELKEDKQDIKTSSSSSSRSHLYSSCSEDESVLGDKEAHAESSPNESVGNSSSQELSGNDVPGKSYFTIEGSLKIEVEGKKIIKADVETNPPMMEESLENVLEEEPKKGTRVIAESLSEKPRKHVSKEEQRNYRSKLWKGSTAKVKDKSAGPCRVEQSVEKILDEAVEPGWHGSCEAEFRISSTDEGKKHLKEPETDTSAALNSNLVEEESTALKSHKESKPLASEIYTLEKEEAVEEDKVPQHRDADTIERKGGIRLWGKAGFDEVPLGEWKPSAEYPALAELLTQEREIPQGKTSRAEADGDRELDKEGLNPMAKEAAKASGGPNEEEAPEKQALMQTISETVKAASEEDGGWGKAVSASQPAMLNLECSQEVVVLGEAVMLEKEEAECGTGSAKPDVEDREEETSIDMEEVEPEEDTASQRRDISEEAICQEEDPVQARGATIGTEISVSIPSSEKAETAQMRVSEESLEKLCKEDEKRKEVDIKVESNKGDDRKETLPEELDAAGGRMKAERPKTPLGENKTQREEVTRANALQVEGILEEEQTFKGEEGEIVKGVKPERGSQVPPNGLEGDVENEASMVASELTGDLGLQEDSLRVGEMTMFEAAPGFEKSPENIIAVKKEGGGERQREAGAPEHKCRAELRCAEDVSPSEHNGGPGPEGQDVSGAPEGDPAGQMPAAELTVTAAGEAQDHAVRDQDDLAGLESGGKKGSLHGQQVVGATGLTQEDSSEGDSSVAEKSSGETIDKDPEEEVDEENALGTSVMTSEQAEGDGNLQEGGVVSEEDFQEKEAAEMAEEKREVSADLKIAERKTEADTGASFSREAGEETWHEVDELLGKTAAADKVAVEEIALSSGEEPAVEEVVIIRASEAEVEDVGLEKMAPQPGPDQKGEETDSSQRAEFLGDKAGRGRHGAVQESSEAEDFGLGLSQETESEPRRESLQDVKIFSIKANCPGTQGKQEHTMQRESENTDVCPNKKP